MEKLLFETSEKISFHEAAKFCENRNLQLIEINSADQLKIIVNKLKTISDDVEWTYWGLSGHTALSYRGWWAGATDEAEEGTWVWTQSGNPVGNFIWFDNQPDNAGGGNGGEGEDYLGLINWRNWGNYDYRGHDVNGVFKLHPLCQQKR